MDNQTKQCLIAGAAHDTVAACVCVAKAVGHSPLSLSSVEVALSVLLFLNVVTDQNYSTR